MDTLYEGQGLGGPGGVTFTVIIVLVHWEAGLPNVLDFPVPLMYRMHKSEFIWVWPEEGGQKVVFSPFYMTV